MTVRGKGLTQYVLAPNYYYYYYFFLNVGPPKEDIFSGHLLSPIFQSSIFTCYISIGFLPYWPQIMLLCAKSKRELVKFVAPPKEMLLSFLCV